MIQCISFKSENQQTLENSINEWLGEDTNTTIISTHYSVVSIGSWDAPDGEGQLYSALFIYNDNKVETLTE